MSFRNILIAIIIIAVALFALDLSGAMRGVGRQSVPLLMLLAAAMIFWRSVRPSEAAATETQFTIPREAAQQARLDVQFGAGSITMSAGGDDKALLAADCFGPIRQQVDHRADLSLITLRQARALHRERANWQLLLNAAVAWQDIRLMCASAEANLDLQALSIDSLRLELGSTQAFIALPTTGNITVEIGRGQTTLTIPAGANVIVENKAKLAEVKFDETLFTPEGDPKSTMPITWHSDDPDPDLPHLHITLRGGFGAIWIKGA